MAYSGRNDLLLWTDGSGKIDVRSDADSRAFVLVRVSDGMEIDTFGTLAAAQARANAAVANGEV